MQLVVFTFAWQSCYCQLTSFKQQWQLSLVNFFLIIFFAGGFPYPTVTNYELLDFLSSGQRLQRPENCSEHLYDLMLQCWCESPDDRPEFHEILTKLEPSHNKIYVDFSELSSDYVFPPTMEQLKNNNLKPGAKS